jgi:hypothetical protein
MLRSTRRLALIAIALVTVATTACGSSSGSASSSSTTPVSASGTAAPKQLFSSDFEGSCQGATVSSATAYDPAAATHKVLLFSTYEDSLVEDITTLPADWQVTFEPDGNAYAAVDLVACAVRTGEAFVEDCTGYERDGVPTQNVAKLHTATYELTIREATTGTELGSTTIAAAMDSCPMFVTFESDDDVVDHFAPPTEDEVTAFLKPFVQP